MAMQLKAFSYAGLSLEQTMTDLAVRFVLNCPPEDLSTPVRLMFQVEEAHWFYLDFARVQNDDLPLFKLKGFVQKLYQIIPVMTTIFEDPLIAVNEFMDYKRGIPVRGGILLNETLDKVLLVRAWKVKSWGFPRGKINKGEDDLVCAIREVYEETGFDMTAYAHRNEYAEKTIDGKNFLMFFAAGVPESTKFVTRTREEIEEIKWIPLAEILSKPTYKTFLVPPFLRDIERYVSRRNRRGNGKNGSKKRNGAAAAPAASAAAPGSTEELSHKESDALKQLLGISDSSHAAVTHDDNSARQLLDMISSKPATVPPPMASVYPSLQGAPNITPVMHAEYPAPLPVLHGGRTDPTLSIGGIGSPAPSHDTRADSHNTLMSLLKPSDDGDKPPTQDHPGEIESVRRILALLNRDTMAENKPPPDTSAPAKDSSESGSEMPSLPQNDMLERLVSSRRGRHSRHQSFIPTKKPKLKQNALLQVLNSTKYTKQNKLIDLLNPGASSSHPKKVVDRGDRSLMKLLGEPASSSLPDGASHASSKGEPDNTAQVPGHELLKLLGIKDGSSSDGLLADVGEPGPRKAVVPEVPLVPSTESNVTKSGDIAKTKSGDIVETSDAVGTTSGNDTKRGGAVETMNNESGDVLPTKGVAMDIDSDDVVDTKGVAMATESGGSVKPHVTTTNKHTDRATIAASDSATANKSIPDMPNTQELAETLQRTQHTTQNKGSPRTSGPPIMVANDENSMHQGKLGRGATSLMSLLNPPSANKEREADKTQSDDAAKPPKLSTYGQENTTAVVAEGSNPLPRKPPSLLSMLTDTPASLTEKASDNSDPTTQADSKKPAAKSKAPNSLLSLLG